MAFITLGIVAAAFSPMARLDARTLATGAVTTRTTTHALMSGVSRRTWVVSAAALPMALSARSAHADVNDLLVTRLNQARDGLTGCEAKINARDRDLEAVRRAVKDTLTPLTMKGYAGESVKSRAAALANDGKSESAAAITDARRAVLISLGDLDRATFEKQTKGGAAEELLPLLDSAVAAVDGLLKIL